MIDLRKTDRTAWLEWALAMAATVVAVYFNDILRLHAGALWRDEAGTLGLAGLPSLSAVWRNMSMDTAPALQPLTVRVWASMFGASDPSLRLLGMLTGLLVVSAFWLHSWSATRCAPLLALSLIALNPLFIRELSAMRAYGLGITAMIAAWILQRRAAEDGRTRTLVAASLAAAVSAQFLYQNGPLSAVFFLAGLLAYRRWSLAAPVLAAALSLCPYLGHLAKARSVMVLATQPSAVGRVFYPLVEALSTPHPALLVLWLGLFVLALVTAAQARRAQPRAVYFAVTLILAPAVVVTLMYLSGFNVQPRYLLLPAVLSSLSLDALLGAPDAPALARRFRVAAAVLAAILLLPSAGRELRKRQSDIGLVTRELAVQARPDDFVVVTDWWLGVGFERAYRGAAPWTTLPPTGPDHALTRCDALKEALATPRPIAPVLARIERTLRAGGRVWIVGNLIFGPEVPEPPPAPRAPWGWTCGNYCQLWTVQTGNLLRAHARTLSFQKFDDEVQEVEALGLGRAEGWRERRRTEAIR